MSAKDGFCEPNTTQTPDALFALMPEIGDAELRVTLHLVRQTLGWRREWSDPDYSTMPAIAKATGMSLEGVRRGLRAGLERGTIERADAIETRSFSYRVRLKRTEVEPDQKPTRQKPSRRKVKVKAVEGQPTRGSTALRVNGVEGQPARGTSLNGVEGQGSTALRDANSKELTPTLTPTNTHKEGAAVLPATRRRSRERKADLAANDTPRPRNERFDAFCKAWAVDPDDPGNKAGLAQAFDTRCRAEGATIEEFRAFYVEAKRAGEWGKYIKPHTTTDDFLAWRRKGGIGDDPFDSSGTPLAAIDQRFLYSVDGQPRLRAVNVVYPDASPFDESTWPADYAEAHRQFTALVQQGAIR